MAKLSKGIGAALLAIAIGVIIMSSYFAISSEDYRKAALLKERNPGHAAYEIQYFVAATIRMFFIGGAVAGVLLGLNGVTLMLLGRVAAQQEGIGGGDRR